MVLKILNKFRKNEDGATAIEYGLIAALVSVAAIGALTAMGDSLEQMFGFVSDSLDSAVQSSSAASGSGTGTGTGTGTGAP